MVQNLVIVILTHSHQTNDNGTLDFEEFCKLTEVLHEWRMIFYKVDANRSGTMEKDELSEAFKLGGRCGYSYSNELFITTLQLQTTPYLHLG